MAVNWIPLCFLWADRGRDRGGGMDENAEAAGALGLHDEHPLP